jgi:glutamate dehydrogenase/leucine dehydrogenase
LLEVLKLTRRYATEISTLFGSEGDIPAPNFNTNQQTMAWIMDTISMHKGYSVTAVVTVSYFEWSQLLQSLFWSEREIEAHFESIIVTAFQKVMTEAAWWYVG